MCRLSILFSIHALLAESDRQFSSRRPFVGEISIHALLAESDGGIKPSPRSIEISIHALLAESDEGVPVVFFGNNPFLSTLSLRRATPQHEHYNPGRIPISIHALLAESDCQRVHCGRCPRNFYPRSPCGRATNSACCGVRRKYISIHALLAESDTLYCPPFGEIKLFLSTLSLAESDTGLKSFFGTWALFLSTLSLRRATVKAFCAMASF